MSPPQDPRSADASALEPASPPFPEIDPAALPDDEAQPGPLPDDGLGRPVDGSVMGSGDDDPE